MHVVVSKYAHAIYFEKKIFKKNYNHDLMMQFAPSNMWTGISHHMPVMHTDKWVTEMHRNHLRCTFYFSVEKKTMLDQHVNLDQLLWDDSSGRYGVDNYLCS